MDILLDMQLHTYGNRLQIIASHPAPLQLNYLVYPASAGSLFHDYLATDCRVTPPEHAVHYSESMLVLPPTYQMSFYDRHVTTTTSPNTTESLDNDNDSERASNNNMTWKLRREYNLPTPTNNNMQYPYVFCNFNKMDKLDGLLSFPVWMNILRRVPGSVLWLLQPVSVQNRTSTNHSTDEDEKVNLFDDRTFNSLLQTNILRMASTYGISAHRIIFANRTSKSQHIARYMT